MEVQVEVSGQRAPLWLPALFVVIGLCVMGAAFRPAPADPGAVPGWVVGCFGGLFATSGLLMLCLRDPASLQSLHVKLLAAIFFSMFATVFGWVGFGSGPRSFSMTVAIGNVATHGTSSETGGRIAFGAFATLVGVLALAIWWSFAKALFSALRRPTGDPPAPM